MDWSQQRVLVTGAGGFIGSHLTERLVAEGADTRALVRYNSTNSRGWLDSSNIKDEIEVFAGDIRDRDSLILALKGVDVVFHLAALIGIPYSYHAPVSYVHTNLEGTLNVLQIARDMGIKKVVHTSTSEVYGTAQSVPIDEGHPLQGQSPYSASKIAADKMAEAFHLSFGLPVTTIRPFNTYGPRQSARAIIPTIVAQALSRSEIRLGNLAPTRDLNYVADTVDGFIKIAQAPQAIGKVINIGSAREISVGDLAQEILTVLNKDMPITCEDERVRPEKSEVERLCADNTRARELIDWSPQVSLRDGLAETVDWIGANIDRYRVDSYVI